MGPSVQAPMPIVTNFNIKKYSLEGGPVASDSGCKYHMFNNTDFDWDNNVDEHCRQEVNLNQCVNQIKGTLCLKTLVNL